MIIPGPTGNFGNKSSIGRFPQVWMIDTTENLPAAMQHRTWLTKQELQQWNEMQSVADRATYLVAHVTLRVILGEILGQNPGELYFGRDRCAKCKNNHGRPKLIGETIQFSLSHTNKYTLIAVHETLVGIDIEPIVPAPFIEEIYDLLYPEEQKHLASINDPEERFTRLTELWTQKEAFIKAIGSGIGAGLIKLGHDTTAALPTPWQCINVPAPKGHRAAIAWRFED